MPKDEPPIVECLMRFPELTVDQEYPLTAHAKNFTRSQEQWIRYHFFHQFVPLNKANGLKAQGSFPTRTLKDAEKMFKRAKQDQFARKFVDERPEAWIKLLAEKWKNMKKQHQSTIDGAISEPDLSGMAALFTVGDERIYARKLHQQDYNQRNQGKKASELNSGAKREWDEMSVGEQSSWQAKAEVLRKQKHTEGLTQETLYRSQQENLARVQVLLQSLIGHSRGQIGHAQFFCMAAYYGENDVLQTTLLEAGSESFEEYLTEADLIELQEHWRDFAESKIERNLPKLHETKLTRSAKGNQYVLPPLDEDKSLKTYRKDLERFLEASWLLVWPASSEMPGIPHSQVLESPQKFFRDGLLEDVSVKIDDAGQIDGSSLLPLSRAITRFQLVNPEISVFKEKDELAAALPQPQSHSEEVEDLTDLNNPEIQATPQSVSPRNECVVPSTVMGTPTPHVVATPDSSHTNVVISCSLPPHPDAPTSQVVATPNSSQTNVVVALSPQPTSSPVSQSPLQGNTIDLPQSPLRRNTESRVGSPTMSPTGPTLATVIHAELPADDIMSSGLKPVVVPLSHSQNAAKESSPQSVSNTDFPLAGNTDIVTTVVTSSNTVQLVDKGTGVQGRAKRGGKGGRGRGRGGRNTQVPSVEEVTVQVEDSGNPKDNGKKRVRSDLDEMGGSNGTTAEAEGGRVRKKVRVQDDVTISGGESLANDSAPVRRSNRTRVVHDRSADNNISHSPAHRRSKMNK
ncbi:hypothetical protein K435DRAFT_860295 [Dendrothele bispora CBS 962.96]|uniref:Uncharacterized protein n=1 Tax=Dendrothele bispora (strain CBS 962.96) TaxID=1314807 RepID=A0A4S8LY91_DENBC|nr:hypothetical protein K435DRAFT_860295 [Dendrothele bispora CBS 962.96]